MLFCSLKRLISHIVLNCGGLLDCLVERGLLCFLKDRLLAVDKEDAMNILWTFGNIIGENDCYKQLFLKEELYLLIIDTLDYYKKDADCVETAGFFISSALSGKEQIPEDVVGL